MVATQNPLRVRRIDDYQFLGTLHEIATLVVDVDTLHVDIRAQPRNAVGEPRDLV
jgi:hypothetical protein